MMKKTLRLAALGCCLARLLGLFFAVSAAALSGPSLYTTLTDHAVQAVSICALLEDLDAVRFLCEDSFLTAKTLTEAIDLVNSSKHPAVISILMEYKKAPAETDAFESLFSF